MKKMTKALSLLMAAALIFSAMPAMPAIAAETETAAAETENVAAEAENIGAEEETAAAGAENIAAADTAVELESITAESEAAETEMAETEVTQENAAETGIKWTGDAKKNPVIDKMMSPSITPPAELHASGGDVGDLKWTLDDAGTLTISGNGALPWYSVPWEDQKANVKKLVVEEGVTGSSSDHFQNMPNLIEAKLANSMSSWGMYSFSGCTSLRSVNIPTGMSSVGYYAFEGCTALETVTIPEGPTAIAQSAFDGCTSLKSIRIPASVKTIDPYAFANCTSLAEVIILNDDVVVRSGAFDNTPWKESMGDFFIINGRLLGYSGTSSEIVIPDTVTTIVARVFYENTDIRKVTIPDSVKTIEGSAFESCTNLEEVNMADSGIELSASSFRNTPWVKSLGDFFIYDNVLYDYNGSSDEVTIPDGVTSIAIDGFPSDCSISKLVMPDSLTNFSMMSVWYLSQSLQSVTLPNNMEAVPQMAFSGFDKLEEVIIGENTTTIYGAAFQNCSSLKTVVIPDCLYSVGELAFGGCSSLEEITLPASTEVIWDACFYDCTSLTKLTIKNKDHYFRSGYPFSWYGDISFNEDLTIYSYAGSEAEEMADYYGINFVPLTPLISLQESELEMPTQKTVQLHAVLDASAQGKAVTWTSSDPDVATVDNNGKVTGRVYGTTTIRASVDGDYGECEVLVLFNDVTDSTKYWFNPVYWAADTGITNGYEGGVYFGPELNCTREQLITFLWRMMGSPNPKSSTQNTFSDVKSGSYYYKAVLWAKEKGITNGYSSGPYKGKFGVGLPVTREDTVTFLYRAAGKPSYKKASSFTDVAKGKYYYDPIMWAAEKGITKGYSSGPNKGKFGVSFNVLRKDIVTFMYRYKNN